MSEISRGQQQGKGQTPACHMSPFCQVMWVMQSLPSYHLNCHSSAYKKGLLRGFFSRYKRKTNIYLNLVNFMLLQATAIAATSNQLWNTKWCYTSTELRLRTECHWGCALYVFWRVYYNIRWLVSPPLWLRVKKSGLLGNCRGQWWFPWITPLKDANVANLCHSTKTAQEQSEECDKEVKMSIWPQNAQCSHLIYRSVSEINGLSE